MEDDQFYWPEKEDKNLQPFTITDAMHYSSKVRRSFWDWLFKRPVRYSHWANIVTEKKLYPGQVIGIKQTIKDLPPRGAEWYVQGTVGNWTKITRCRTTIHQFVQLQHKQAIVLYSTTKLEG